jgi:L-rhamnose isomerase
MGSSKSIIYQYLGWQNRIVVWTLRVLLNALLETRYLLNQYETEGDFSSCLALVEELKVRPPALPGITTANKTG